jgi:hypothetical protein
MITTAHVPAYLLLSNAKTLVAQDGKLKLIFDQGVFCTNSTFSDFIGKTL